MINIIFILSLIVGRDTIPPQVSGTFPEDSVETELYHRWIQILLIPLL